MGYRGDPSVTPGRRGSGSTSYDLTCERAGKKLLAPQARAASRIPDLDGRFWAQSRWFLWEFVGCQIHCGCLAHFVSCLKEPVRVLASWVKVWRLSRRVRIVVHAIIAASEHCPTCASVVSCFWCSVIQVMDAWAKNII